MADKNRNKGVGNEKEYKAGRNGKNISNEPLVEKLKTYDQLRQQEKIELMTKDDL